MASGTKDNNFHSGYTLRLIWDETAVNQSANTSTVNVKIQLITAAGHTIQSSYAKNISITCDGQTKSSTCMVSISGNQTKTLMEANFTVTHNADGSKTAAISCTLGLRVNLGGKYYGNVEVSASAALTKIARNPNAPTKFTITAGNGDYVGLGETVTLTWSGASGVITGYQIRYSRGNSGWKDYKTVSSTATSGSTTDSFTYTDIGVNDAGNTVQYAIRALNGSLASAWTYSNKLTISGGMDLKVSNAWRTGSVWIKVSGTWRRAKRIWIKVGGTWRSSK